MTRRAPNLAGSRTGAVPASGSVRPGSRLVVVSNRIPLTFRREAGRLTAVPSSGGLVSALEPILSEHGGVWVGSAGTEDCPELHEQLDAATREHRFRYAPVLLSEEEQANYYEGFSNEVLWPLFHDLQSLCVFDPIYYQFYEQVNQKFSQVVESVSEPSDTIWVHDYQLLRLAHALRQRRPQAWLAFFLHIPFPPPDIFAKLPWRREILEGLLAHDCVGVQTARDEHNLVTSIRAYMPGAKVVGRGDQRIAVTGRGATRIRAIPISIDYRKFAEAARSTAVAERLNAIRVSAPEMEIALGVDRLDYTKGIPERVRALRVFFRTFPQFRRKLTLIQVVVPSRENIPGYQELRAEIEQLVSSVNGEFGEPGWTPIQYIHRSVSSEELIALYQAAGVALVTPLKDGMNLVAKEYCAAQINNAGVLILSEFAGAMPELRGGAIVVHPYDQVGIASALRQAMEMPLAEKRRRMMRMRQQIRHFDILRWRDRILEQMRNITSTQQLAA
jgi:trehalose 6-phosphate synthase/phosphatase